MKRPHLRHPVPVIAHMPGVFELERLADEIVTLADQIKRTARQQLAEQAEHGDDAGN